MQIGEIAARTELSLRTIRNYEDAGLLVPSARSQGGLRLYTEADVDRLMVIRRMKLLGFTLDGMCSLLKVTDCLDSGEEMSPEKREALLDRVRDFEEEARQQVAELRSQLTRAEAFAATLSERLPQTAALTPLPVGAEPGPA